MYTVVIAGTIRYIRRVYTVLANLQRYAILKNVKQS